MYLSKLMAEQLINKGFKRTVYTDEVAPFDFYQYGEEEWVIGGRILPNSNLLADESVYQNGFWLPSIYDLLYWLEDHNYEFTISHLGSAKGFKIRVKDEQKELISKGGTLETTLFKLIINLLDEKS